MGRREEELLGELLGQIFGLAQKKHGVLTGGAGR
jgi:hypothetical protein